MLNLRTFIKSDWYGFAGASKLTDGTGPFIGNRNGVTVIVSGFQDCGKTNGIEVTLEDDEGTAVFTLFDLTPALALHIALNFKAERMNKTVLLALGFEQIN